MVKYIVQRGDTLGDIAAKYGTSVQAIIRANGIRNPNMIHPGQILKVPSEMYDDNNHYGYKKKHYHYGQYHHHDNFND